MVWYLPKCHKCEIENDQVDQEVNSINSVEPPNLELNGTSSNKSYNVVKVSNGIINGKTEILKPHLPEFFLSKKEKVSL
jgi:hypothetical protein